MAPITRALEVLADKASRVPLSLMTPARQQPATILEGEWPEENFVGEARGLGQQWPEDNPATEDLQLRPSSSQLIRHIPKPLVPAAVVEKGALAPLWVVLDLDHTLVYSQEYAADGYDFYFTKGKQAAYVWKRPGLDLLLSWLRQSRVEAVVYTAASSSYAEGVSRHLDPDGTLFRRRFSRGDCPLTPPAKDLMRLGCDLRRTVLVDDSLSALRLQPDNGIPVTAYTGGGADEEIPRVQALLEELLQVEDVRKVLRGRFRVAERLRKRATRQAAGALATAAAALAAGRERAAAAAAAAAAPGRETASAAGREAATAARAAEVRPPLPPVPTPAEKEDRCGSLRQALPLY